MKILGKILGMTFMLVLLSIGYALSCVVSPFIIGARMAHENMDEWIRELAERGDEKPKKPGPPPAKNH